MERRVSLPGQRQRSKVVRGGRTMKTKEVKGRQREMADAVARAEEEENLEEGRPYVRPRPPRDPAQVYSVRIPTSDLAELRAMAEYQGVTPSALIRQLVVDHIASMRK